MGYGYGYVMGYGSVQTVACMEHIGNGFFDFRLCDSMLLTAYHDISRGQAHDGF